MTKFNVKSTYYLWQTQKTISQLFQIINTFLRFIFENIIDQTPILIIQNNIQYIFISNYSQFTNAILTLFNDLQLCFHLNIFEQIESKIFTIVFKMTGYNRPFLNKLSDVVNQNNLYFSLFIFEFQKLSNWFQKKIFKFMTMLLSCLMNNSCSTCSISFSLFFN